ncbi:MAG: AsmA family protein [Pseudomonadota bacterium]
MRWIIRIGVTFAVLAVVVVAAILLVPTERIVNLAAERFQSATGRTLTVSGPVRATLWPSLGVRAEGIEIADGTDTLLTARSLDLGVGLSGLRGDTIKVERLAIDGARLSLRRAADGTGNWEVPSTSSAAVASDASESAASARRNFSIDAAILTDAEVRYEADGQVWQVRALDLNASLPDPSGALTVEASALLAGQAISVSMRADQPMAFVDGTIAPILVTLTSGGTTLDWDGRVDPSGPAAQGQLGVQTTDGAAVLTAFGLDPLDLPAGFGRDRLALDAAVTLTSEGRLSLRETVVTLDENRVSGEIDIDPSDSRPRIAASLETDGLALVSDGGAGSAGSTTASDGWDQETLDVSGLFAADADIALRSGPIAMDGFGIDALAARITLDNGRAVTTLQPLVAYGGQIKGDLVVNGRGGLSMRTDLELSGLRMQPLLSQVAGTDRLVAPLDARLNLLAVGNSQAALMRSLEGAFAFNLGQGEIEGLDVVGMIRNFDPSFRGAGRKTVFDNVSARFEIADGVARGDDFRLDAPLLTADGEGSIDIGAQTLDWRLTPRLRQADGVTVPILFSGPWDDPSIRPDFDFVARQRIDAERAEAEEAAKRKLAEELNVAPETLTDREAIEDAIVDRVQDRLLDKLFNR